MSNKSGKSGSDAREALLRDFDRASGILLDAHEVFVGEVASQAKNLEVMQLYLSDLTEIVDNAAPPGKRRYQESKKLKDGDAFVLTQAVIQDTRLFFAQKIGEIDAQFKLPDLPVPERIVRLPLDIQSVSQMRWAALDYKAAVPLVAARYADAFAEFSQRSESLPVSFREYRQKYPAYKSKCNDILKDLTNSLLGAHNAPESSALVQEATNRLRDETVRTFDAYKARHRPQLVVPKKGPPTLGK